MPAPSRGEQLLKVSDVAARLGVTQATVYNWIHAGRIPFVRFAGTYRFEPSDVEHFIALNRHVGDGQA